jgi:hypothetical protein
MLPPRVGCDLDGHQPVLGRLIDLPADGALGQAEPVGDGLLAERTGMGVDN